MNLTTSLRLLAAVGIMQIGVPAAAQSNVTISGSLDIGVFRDTAGVTNVGTIQRSHIQFAGSEDLGDGLAATFRLRHRLHLDTGTPEGNGSKPFWHGESTVGLRGGFGALRLGRALDAIQSQDWAFRPLGELRSPRVACLGPLALELFGRSGRWRVWLRGQRCLLRLAEGRRLLTAYQRLAGVACRGRDQDPRRVAGLQQWHAARAAGHRQEQRRRDRDFARPARQLRLGVGHGAVQPQRVGGGLEGQGRDAGSHVRTRRNTSEGRLGPGGCRWCQEERLTSVGAKYSLSKRTSIYADLASKRFSTTGTKQVYGVGLTHSF